MKFITLIFFCFTFMASSLFADTEQIKVGVFKSAPPFSIAGANNHYFGFCIDLMDEICKRLNVQCEYISINEKNITKEIDTDTVDITFSPNPITQTDMGNYVISLPYLPSFGEFVTMNPNIKTINDIKNKTIGVLKGSHLEHIVLNYTTKDKIKEYPLVSHLLNAIANNDVDAALLNSILVNYLTNNQSYSLRSISKPFSLGNGYGIIALKEHAPLIDKINKILIQMQNDGTYTTIYNKYFSK